MAPNLTHRPSDELPEPLEVLQLVVSTLNELRVPYMVGGSIASSVYGPPRTTQDADLVIELTRNQIDPFIQAVLPEFYVDRGLIERAVAERSSFNIIHLKSSFKIDFFILREESFHLGAFHRRQLREVDPYSGVWAYLQSAEDTLLHKLICYRQGGCVSENQWRDTLGILKGQEERLDWLYLRRWAQELQIADLLERARQEAGVE
jgi:hypothetical protein